MVGCTLYSEQMTSGMSKHGVYIMLRLFPNVSFVPDNFTFQNKSYSRSDCTGFMANEQEMVVVIVSKKIGHHILIS